MILSFITGTLLGCKRRESMSQYTVDDIASASTSYGCMDRSLSYSFYIHRSNGGWLLDAECFVGGNEREVVLTDHPLAHNDTDELLAVLERTNAILNVENIKSAKHNVRAADGDSYVFCIAFADGKLYTTYKRQTELESLCYRLAKEYSEA